MRRRACSSRNDAEARAPLGDRPRLAQVRDETQGSAAFRHRDRRAGHSLHPRALEARERAADDRDARMARLDHRTAEDHRAPDQPDGARRKRLGRVPSRDSVDAGLRVFGQADEHRLGRGAHRADLDRPHEAPGLPRDTSRKAAIGGAHHDHMGVQAPPDWSVSTPTWPVRFHRTSTRRRLPARRRLQGCPPRKRQRTIQPRLLLLHARPGLRPGDRQPPQTLYGIADSPVGLAAWILDHDIETYGVSPRSFDGKPRASRRDDILDNITFYWLTNTGSRRRASTGKTRWPSSSQRTSGSRPS